MINEDYYKAFKVNRWAAIGSEKQMCFGGKIVDFKAGTVTIQHVNYEFGLLEPVYTEYDLYEICDYVYAVDVHDTFSDAEGNQYDFLTHLRIFEEDWNKFGYDGNH